MYPYPSDYRPPSGPVQVRSGTHCVTCGARVTRDYLTLSGGVVALDWAPDPLPGCPAPTLVVRCPRCDAYDPSDDR